MRIVLLGPPGAGKGTQASSLAIELGVPHVASGDLFRDAVRQGTALGLKAKHYMDRGELVPDDLTTAMVLERLEQPDAANGVILDGFPRTHAQATSLDRELHGIGQQIDLVLNLEVPDDVLISRLSGRWICRQCQRAYHEVFNPPTKPGVCDACGGDLYQREDDRRETAVRRLEVYERQTAPLIDYYRERSLLREVNGDQTVEEVRKALVDAVTQGSV